MNNEEINTLYNEKNILITEKDILMILQKYIPNIKINNFKHFINAFVHKSYCKKNNNNIEKYVNNNKALELFDYSYERMEFLGDKVVKLSIGIYLFFRYPELDEGFMTRLQIKLEDKDTLAYLSKELNLGKFFIISKQIEMQNGRNIDKIHEDVFEAFICSLYLSNGYNTCLLLITNLLETLIDYSDKLYCDNNYKDNLLRIFHQKKWLNGPNYKLLHIDGPVHKRKYIMGVENNDKNSFLGYGMGYKKKEAEQKAAKMALILLGVLNKDQYNQNDIYHYDLINNDEIIIQDNIEEDIEEDIELTSEIKEEQQILPYNINNKLITHNDIIEILKKNNIYITIDKIKNFEYIIQSFTHKSYCKKKYINTINNDTNTLDLFDTSYEKLKYIGIQVLKLSIATYLYFRYPNQDEGFMTKLQIKIEKKNNFIIMSKELELEKFFIISQQFEELHTRNYDKLHEEIFKSFIGGIFLSCGFEVCLLLITNLLETIIDYSDKLYFDDNYKDQLIRLYHQMKNNNNNEIQVPIYILLDDDGPSHKKTYIIGVKKPYYDNNLPIYEQIIGCGIGCSKKNAEQKAAKMALIKLNYLNKDQYEYNDIYYYDFYKEKLEKYLNIELTFILINELNNNFIVKFNYNKLISYGIGNSKKAAEKKAAKMALILLNQITNYSSDDLYYYNNDNLNYSEKSI